MTLPLIFLALAALADAYTSRLAFKAGKVELNPFIAKLFGKRPSFGALLLVKVVTFGAIAYFGTPTAIYVAAAVWALVAVHNWRQR